MAITCSNALKLLAEPRFASASCAASAICAWRILRRSLKSFVISTRPNVYEGSESVLTTHSRKARARSATECSATALACVAALVRRKWHFLHGSDTRQRARMAVWS